MLHHTLPLDAELAADQTEGDSAFAFLANLLPAINLTEDESNNERLFIPRESNKTAEPLFDCIARQLHRQDAQHLVLTGPAGIGKTETVRELTRRCRCGAYPFLADAALLWFDCSAVGPEDSRGCLETVLAVARDRAIKELRPLCFVQKLEGTLVVQGKTALAAAQKKIKNTETTFDGLLELVAVDRDYKRLPALRKPITDAMKAARKDSALRELLEIAKAVDRAKDYESQKDLKQALKAWQLVQAKFPKSPAAKLARERIAAIEKQGVSAPAKPTPKSKTLRQ